MQYSIIISLNLIFQHLRKMKIMSVLWSSFLNMICSWILFHFVNELWLYIRVSNYTHLLHFIDVFANIYMSWSIWCTVGLIQMTEKDKLLLILMFMGVYGL